jgi:hypothetical protein
MAYADFSEAYLTWLKSQIDYIAGEPYTNFRIEIDPTFEVTSFKQSVDINQQKIFHNAADDQVATLRALKEIDKTPSDYLTEYEAALEFEIDMIQSTAIEVANTHDNQESSDNSTSSFNATFAPKVVDNFGRFNPMRIFD